MTRRLERVTASTPVAAATYLLDCPAGHKFEVVTVCYITNSSTWCEFLTAVFDGALNPLADDLTVPAGTFCRFSNYEAIVVYAGEQFGVYPLSPGAPGAIVSVTYVDVFPV